MAASDELVERGEPSIKRRPKSHEQDVLFVVSEEARASRRTGLIHIASDDGPVTIDPRSVFLTALEVIERYGWGRTKGYRLMRGEDFPRAIGGDRYRLDTLIAWENAQLAAARAPKPAPMLPARKRVRAS